jgi:phosphoribosylaminoimidazole carboxylase/phosphoribosylaminoimidazole-succinocarboxamide synthase
MKLQLLDNVILSFLYKGLGCTTVVNPESAALAAAQIHALHDHTIWSRLRMKKFNNFLTLKMADKMIRDKEL